MPTVGNHQQGAFANPQNGQSGDASVVLANDNANRVTTNAHDADATIHVQSSVLASRPAAGTAQRVWITTDGLRLYMDSGSVWGELAYLPSVGGTVSGAVTISSGGIAVTGNSTITGTLSGITTLTATSLTGTITTAAQPNITSVGVLASTHLTSPVVDSGGLTVTAGGLTVSAGTTAVQALTATGATVSGGVTVTGANITVDNGAGLVVAGTLRVQALSTGAAVTGALTVSAGFTVTTGGATVTAGGLLVSAGGAAITGNSTITGTLGGLTGLTVASGGATITAGGITVTAGDVNIAAGVVKSSAQGMFGAWNGTGAAGFLSLSTDTAATASSGTTTLPATPQGFFLWRNGTTVVKVPYYNA